MTRDDARFVNPSKQWHIKNTDHNRIPDHVNSINIQIRPIIMSHLFKSQHTTEKDRQPDGLR